MKTAIALAGLIILAVGMALDGHAQENSGFWQSIKNPATLAQLKSFVAAKEAQANAATNRMPEEFKTFFSAVDRGDWLTVSNIFEDVCQRNGQYWTTNEPDWRLRGTPWSAVQEIWGAFAAFNEGDEKYSQLFGNEIIRSIPPGSIYFGGTDPGRFIITAMQKSQIKADPFFTLTQNALTDGLYLNYLRSMYGNRIYIPISEDSDKCFKDFYSDVEKRYKKNQLKAGEEVTVNSNGVLQVSGEVTVMEINGLLAKVIFDKETNRELYVEESYPLDWMYPYLEPHGLIFKLDHKPLSELPREIVQQDHDYWAKTVSSMIGDWLNENTTVVEVAGFAEKTLLRHDLNGFKGDPEFVQNPYSYIMFSTLCDSIGGLYAWRAKHSRDDLEKESMNREADFAFRQACALCPYSPVATFRYVQFLMDNNRSSDALLVAETAAKFHFDPEVDHAQIQNLVSQLKQYIQSKQQQSSDWTASQVSAMEQEARLHPLNYTNIYWLTYYYAQIQQTNRAVELWKQTISSPDTPAGVRRWAAEFFAEIDDFTNLETVLEKLTVDSPDVPEPRYDLARVDARLGKNEEAIENLRTAIDLSDQQLKINPKALNLRDWARTNTIDFTPIRNTPEFQKLVGP